MKPNTSPIVRVEAVVHGEKTILKMTEAEAKAGGFKIIGKAPAKAEPAPRTPSASKPRTPTSVKKAPAAKKTAAAKPKS